MQRVCPILIPHLYTRCHLRTGCCRAAIPREVEAIRRNLRVPHFSQSPSCSGFSAVVLPSLGSHRAPPSLSPSLPFSFPTSSFVSFLLQAPLFSPFLSLSHDKKSESSVSLPAGLSQPQREDLSLAQLSPDELASPRRAAAVFNPMKTHR